MAWIARKISQTHRWNGTCHNTPTHLPGHSPPDVVSRNHCCGPPLPISMLGTPGSDGKRFCGSTAAELPAGPASAAPLPCQPIDCWKYLLAVPVGSTCWQYLLAVPVGSTCWQYLLAVPGNSPPDVVSCNHCCGPPLPTSILGTSGSDGKRLCGSTAAELPAGPASAAPLPPVRRARRNLQLHLCGGPLTVARSCKLRGRAGRRCMASGLMHRGAQEVHVLMPELAHAVVVHRPVPGQLVIDDGVHGTTALLRICPHCRGNSVEEVVPCSV